MNAKDNAENNPSESDKPSGADKGPHFVEAIIQEDIADGKNDGRVHTRFPPEPNGYLHIGHAKAICVDFGLAKKYQGQCNLRFDDTNPTAEDIEYVDSIKNDVRWLGFEWDNLFYASEYFDKLYDMAEQLIRDGKAYVCSLKGDQIREYRGGWDKPGKDSPDRNRSVEENLELFAKMKAGEFAEGELTLRAKIDMNSPNMNLRDPIMYRIMHVTHHSTGDTWKIYPTYDFAHGQSDAIEGITHSLCTLEFEDHRPLYDWYLDQLNLTPRPRQIEFARLVLTYTVMSKRKLRELVEENLVSGWDDPRMPTLSGLRRRGYTPESIRAFCERIGVSKFNSTIDKAWLEDALREDLNRRAPRAMAVLRPLKVVITNYPEGEVEELDAVNNPEDESAGLRKVPFSKTLYIEQSDFMEDPPKKFFRLGPGREVRLRWAYFLKCEEVIKDDAGEIVELRCTYDPETKGGKAPDGRKVKGTLHWVSAEHAIDAEVRLYDHLFNKPDPDKVAEGEDWKANINPDSLEVLTGCKLEPSLAVADEGVSYQFERNGYFCLDPSGSIGKPVFNRAVSLRDTWAKVQNQGQKKKKK